jgi:hypothetical protein
MLPARLQDSLQLELLHSQLLLVLLLVLQLLQLLG